MPRKKKAKEEEVYHVEVITKARVGEEGDWEYFVKWACYDSDADSWEPAANVQQCNRLLASFWRHVGTDDGDYLPGYQVDASEDWINKEKRFFAETFTKPSNRKSDKGKQKERQRSKSSTSEGPVDESQSSDEESAPSTPAKKFHKQPRVVSSESDPESDDQTRKQRTARPMATAPLAKELPKIPAQPKRQQTSATSSSSITLPKAPVIRTHQDQRANPLVKSISISSKSVEAGSMLSTKQRIAAGIPPPPTGPKPLPHGPKKSLSSLSFKKNKPPVPPSIQTMDIAVPTASVATLTSPVAEPTDIVNDVDVVASPQPMDIDQSFDSFDFNVDDVGPANKSPEIPTATIPPKSQSEINAERFLQTVDIPALHAPLEIVAAGQPEQPTIELSKSASVSKIPKKWKWSGDLLISTSESETESLCAINITDPGGMSNSAHINLLLSKLDTLQISRLYPIMDLSPLIRACGKPQYFGRLESNEPSEEVIIQGLEHYLKNEALAAVIPLLHDGTEAAVLFVFPTAQQGLTKVLQVPDLLLSETLLVVLLPFLVSTIASTKAVGWRSIEVVQQSLHNPEDVTYDPAQDVVLHQAMSLSGFPKMLLDFLNNSSTSRSYCIWPLPDQLPPAMDSSLLQYILKSTKAMLGRAEEDVRVIFISNRHLEMLHTLPSVVSKRLNSPEVQFWTYGYSADLASERWRVKEIFPLGGIITFTASALAEDLVTCHKLISQIEEHPLWDCYLIPEVLAAFHLLCCDEKGSPNQPLIDPILDLINVGSISVMRVPERGQTNQLAWLSQTFHPSTASGHQLLEFHLETLGRSQISAMTTDQLVTSTNDEITKDLLKAQTQPVFMENYRRFVVIKATSEDAIQFDKDGLEWTSPSLFSFKDDYFHS